MELERIERKEMFKAYNNSKLKKPKEALPLECRRVLLEENKRLERILKRLNQRDDIIGKKRKDRT